MMFAVAGVAILGTMALALLRAVLGPGINLIVPFVDTVAHKVSILERQLPNQRQDAITTDNVLVQVETSVFYRIMEPEKTVYRIRDVDAAILTTVAGIVRSEIGTMELDEVQSNRARLTQKIGAAIADVVDKFNIPAVKCTGGQRIDMLGIRKEDLPAVWADLGKAGFVSGQAYAKGLRTVKTCVGTDWCRFGTQDSTGLGIKLEKFMWGSWTPAKLKMAVSGCPRNCAEATCKDIGIICVDSGYEIHFAGAAGLDIKGTEVLGLVKTEEEAIEHVAALTQMYREQGHYLERIYKWAKRIGLDEIRRQIMDDEAMRKAYFDRFVFSQKFAQVDPWSERVSGKDKHEFKPMAVLTKEAAE
mgnify:CR=1 FL=1